MAPQNGLVTVNGKATAAEHGSTWLSWLCCNAGAGTAKPRGASTRMSAKRNPKTRELNDGFCEHIWGIEELDDNFPESNIDVHKPAKSRGLTTQRCQEILKMNGPNSLPRPKEISNLRLFIRQFWNLLWALLIAAASLSLISFFMDPSDMVNLYITLIVYGMIVFMCFVSWFQEMEARKAVRGFNDLLPESCSVIRDGGRESIINASDVMVGDIIRIRSGSRVPADVRILSCKQLKIEASSITGEAEPIDMRHEPVPASVTIFESHNIAFNGSLCVDGEGVGVVIRTATDTVIGQIATLTTCNKEKESRLNAQVGRFVKFLVIMSIGVATIAFIIGGSIRHWTNIMWLISNGYLVCAIGMVPCGLPATITSILSLIAFRLARKHVYLKRLDICEPLGQVSIIATDKTGTLTRNIMTVTDLWHENTVISGFPKGAQPVGRKIKTFDGYFPSPIAEMLTCMTVCNAAAFLDRRASSTKKRENDYGNKKTLAVNGHNAENGEAFHEFVENACGRKTTGGPSDVAMIEYVDQMVDIEALRRSFDVVFEVPFNSARKWQMMIVRGRALEGGQQEYRILIKGASEILARKCSKILTPNGERPFDAIATEHFQSAYNAFAENGRRVIGFAQGAFVAPADIEFDLSAENVPMDGFTFLGTCAIMDPPRNESAGAVAACKRAGIKVFMVTGDHHLTASAIARQIGLIGENTHKLQVIPGERVAHLTEQEWDTIVHNPDNAVFARTTPEQKLYIVQQCQKRNMLIAMTGDGVNDAPALKKADVGIAMGSGSEVAKQASDIVLTDDNFSSIVRGVEEGRTMYENIKKLLGYTMVHSFPEAYPIIVNFCLGFPPAITALQILFIDLGSEIAPGVSLSHEPTEGDVMSRKPRKMNKVLVSNSLLAYAYLYTGQIQSLGCFLAYCYVFYSHGIYIPDLWMSALTCWKKDGDVFHSNGRSFSVDEQLYIVRQACSAWQMGIIYGQFWHIWSARTRRQSLFTHGIFSNKKLLIGVAVEHLLVVAYVYMPGLNTFLGGAPIPLGCWAIVAGVGLFIFAYNEARKYLIRTYPHNRWVRYIKW